MSTAMLVEPVVWTMADKKRKYGPAKLDVEVIALAKKAAQMRERTLADYLSDLVRENAPYDIQEEAAKVAPKTPRPPKRAKNG